MAGQRDVERPHRPRAVRGGRAALALTLLAVPAPAQASLAGLQQTWAAARDGFGDELAAGSLTREELRELLARFEAWQERSMLANRIALEAAIALKDPGRAQRATAAWFPAFNRVRAEVVQLRELGRYDRSRRLLEGARELLPGDSPYQPYVLQALAIDTCVFQEWETTLDLVAQAIERLPEPSAHRRPLLVDLLVLRADTLLDMGLPDLALEPIAGALEEVAAMRAEGLPAGSAALVAARARAEYLTATDRYERLIEEVEGVLSGIESVDELSGRDRRVRTRLLTLLGHAHAELGAEDAEHLERAEHLFRETLAEASDPVERFTCLAHLGWMSLSVGRIEEAARWIAAAREGLAETATDPYRRDFLAALEGRLALATEDPAQLREQQAALESSVEQMIATWEAGEMRPGGLALLRYTDRRLVVATLMEMALTLEGAEGPEEALRILYRVTSAGTLVRRLGSTGGDLRSYRESLPPGGGALVYLVGRDRSHVFALERDRLAHAELSGEWPLWRRVEALQRLLVLDPQGLDEPSREQRAAELQRAAQDLSRALLPEPIAARVLTWESLVVIGSDLLYEPAFECLPVGGQPLGTTRALSYVASMPLATGLAERAAARSGTEELDSVRLLAGVRPPPGSGLAELPLGTEQAQRLTGALGARAELLLGNDATHARLAEGLGNAGALVILSHGLRDPTDERPSQILLAAPEGAADPLSCDEVEALASPPVVFLGVCGSARGPAREGTGPAAHLGGAFLLAGADAVVLSDADLSLGPTALLAEVFLGRLRAGDGPAEAMRQARLALLAAGWSDPHDWGSMRVVGLGGGG